MAVAGGMCARSLSRGTYDCTRKMHADLCLELINYDFVPLCSLWAQNWEVGSCLLKVWRMLGDL